MYSWKYFVKPVVNFFETTTAQKILRIGHIYWGYKWKTSFLCSEYFILKLVQDFHSYFNDPPLSNLFQPLRCYFNNFPMTHYLHVDQKINNEVSRLILTLLLTLLHCMTSFLSGLCTLAWPQTRNNYTWIFLSLLQYFLSMLRRKRNLTIKHNIPMVVKHSLCIYMHLTISPYEIVFTWSMP